MPWLCLIRLTLLKGSIPGSLPFHLLQKNGARSPRNLHRHWHVEVPSSHPAEHQSNNWFSSPLSLKKIRISVQLPSPATFKIAPHLHGAPEPRAQGRHAHDVFGRGGRGAEEGQLDRGLEAKPRFRPRGAPRAGGRRGEGVGRGQAAGDGGGSEPGDRPKRVWIRAGSSPKTGGCRGHLR